jgi:hypothetical protein
MFNRIELGGKIIMTGEKKRIYKFLYIKVSDTLFEGSAPNNK